MGTFGNERRPSIGRTAIGALLLVSVSASAEETPGPTCDPNLKPFQETEDQKTVRLTCEAHVGCRMFFAYVRTTCNAADFLRKLKDTITAGKPVDNDAVAEAGMGEYPRSAAGDAAISKARDAGRLTPGQPAIRDTFKTTNGEEAYREVQETSTGTSKGTIVYSNGLLARGSLRHDYENNDMMIANRTEGPGQIISANGTWKAGWIDGKGRVSGQSAWYGFDSDGTKAILEGTFVGNQPDGEMVRRYSDGVARRERWSRGQLLKVGKLSGPDGIPPPLDDVAIPVPPGPYFEGVNGQSEGNGVRWRNFLACNNQVVAIGPWFEAGSKSIDPDPSICPRPETYRNKFVPVLGPDGKRRDEYWCRGRLIASTPWKTVIEPPSYLPNNLNCDDPIPVDEDEVIADAPTPKPNEGIDGKPKNIAAGLPIDPLNLNRPPWPCPNEISAYLRSRPAVPTMSTQAFWAQFQYKPVSLLVGTLTNAQIIGGLHQQYLARTPNAYSQPVVFNMNGLQYREGFFRNRQSMQELGSALEAVRAREYRGGEVETLMALHACTARYFAEYARN